MRAEAEVGVTRVPRIAKACQQSSTGSWEKGMEQILPRNPSERAQPCRHPDVAPQASRTGGEYIPVAEATQSVHSTPQSPGPLSLRKVPPGLDG